MIRYCGFNPILRNTPYYTMTKNEIGMENMFVRHLTDSGINYYLLEDQPLC